MRDEKNKKNYNIRLKEAIDFGKKNKLFRLLIFLTFLSSLRHLLLPLSGDEITYSKIAHNILFNGKYYLHSGPSTIPPILPLIIAFFYTAFNPAIGFILAKLCNFIFLGFGLRYCYLFLKKAALPLPVISILLLLTVVNSNFILWSLYLYPEAILFCFFWMFIYYTSKVEFGQKDALMMFISLSLLVITRYHYAVLGGIAVFKLFPLVKEQYQQKEFTNLRKIGGYALITFLPLLFWFKYVLNVEQEMDLSLSYFNRFKNQGLWYNIQAGLGLIKHAEVGNINGTPAFASLFLPITGFRNWILSIILFLSFIIGFIPKLKGIHFKILFAAILLSMGGLIFAGTGFSRYWLVLLPGFLLGFYLFSKFLRFDDKIFITAAKVVAVIYVINEVRLTVKVLTNFL